MLLNVALVLEQHTPLVKYILCARAYILEQWVSTQLNLQSQVDE